MASQDHTEHIRWSLSGFINRRISSSRLSEWRWRLAGIMLVLAYLAQDAAGLQWEWLSRLQTADVYKYATGVALLLFMGWQWYLFVARLKGKRVQGLTSFHQRSGVLAPVIFYVHSMQIGYGYLAVLSWIFLGSVVIGMANPVGIRIRNRLYRVSWLATHVMLASLIAVLALFHAYIALYYK